MESVSCSSLSCDLVFLLHRGPVDFVRYWGGEALSSLMIVSCVVVGPESLACDLQESFLVRVEGG